MRVLSNTALGQEKGSGQEKNGGANGDKSYYSPMTGFIKTIPKAVTGGYLLGALLLLVGVLWNFDYLNKGYYTQKYGFVVRGGPAVLGICATVLGAGFLIIYSTILLLRFLQKRSHEGEEDSAGSQ